jgi:transposase
VAAVIRVEAIWMASAPVDMRAGAEKLLACVVAVFGQARAHHAYLFANRRATRMKLLVHDGIGVWLASRRLNRGHFVHTLKISPAQFDALILGLAWAVYRGGRCDPGVVIISHSEKQTVAI